MTGYGAQRGVHTQGGLMDGTYDIIAISIATGAIISILIAD